MFPFAVIMINGTITTWICDTTINQSPITCFRDILHRIFFGRGLCLVHLLFRFGGFLWLLHILILWVWRDRNRKCAKKKKKASRMRTSKSSCHLYQKVQFVLLTELSISFFSFYKNIRLLNTYSYYKRHRVPQNSYNYLNKNVFKSNHSKTISNLSPSLNSISYSKESWKGYISLLILHFINHALNFYYCLNFTILTNYLCKGEKRCVISCFNLDWKIDI